MVQPGPRTGVVTEPMTDEERNEFAAHEQVIKQGLKSFIEVGNALVIIREGRLYRAEHITFESYCRAQWQMGRSRAYRLIDASAVTEAMLPIGNTLPTTDLRKIDLSSDGSGVAL